MGGRVVAIGDIHGCATAFETLLQAIAPTAEDLIVALGDVLDRGPDSRRVLNQLLDLKQRCRFQGVLGNHEEMFLDVVDGYAKPQAWVHFGGAATLDSYGFSGDLSVVPEEHLELLRGFVEYLETEEHFFVHANYDSELPLEKQDRMHLRWLSLAEVFPGPHVNGKTAIVGHTAEKSGEVFSVPHLKCIDTYCYGGGWLTAYEVGTDRIWQANEDGVLRR